jgi:hypothetical protein
LEPFSTEGEGVGEETNKEYMYKKSFTLFAVVLFGSFPKHSLLSAAESGKLLPPIIEERNVGDS